MAYLPLLHVNDPELELLAVHLIVKVLNEPKTLQKKIVAMIRGRR
jgi:hypothetical protein